MIPRECKRLAEVDFPIATVSRYAAREKSLRLGLPSNLHLWWARRPLGSCRAMLLTLLLPDPTDPNCPDQFKTAAREILRIVPGRVGNSDEELREALLRFAGDFANWGQAGNATFLEVSRSLVKAAHPDETPLVADPFAGGGSIPLEALRLGCDVFASDLNPVASLILKVLLEDIPRFGPSLAGEIRRIGAQIKVGAATTLASFYPADPDGSKPITYLWARTVRCEAPNCGAEIPLMRSFWLCKKAKRRWALRHQIIRQDGGRPPGIAFEIFEPGGEGEVSRGTVTQARATCLCCRATLPPDRVRAQLREQRGGANAIFDPTGRRIGGAQLLAVATLSTNGVGRNYRLPCNRDYKGVYAAVSRVSNMDESKFPGEMIPRTELRRISLPMYGITHFRDMFTARQLLALSEIAGWISQSKSDSEIIHLLALCLGKTADLNNANTRWKPDAECPVATLARHDIPAAWDFAEAAPFGEASGSFYSAYERTASSIIPSYINKISNAVVECSDACTHPLTDESVSVWFTDPPYYDAVPYAHLSDFFYVWEKRALGGVVAGHRAPLTPKENERVVDRHRDIPDAKTAKHFEASIRRAMAEGSRLIRNDGIASVVFAHKTTEGWEALLSGIIEAKWVITASWPVVTEMQSRMNARDNASLA